MMATVKIGSGESAHRPEQASAVRASISFPPDIYRNLENIARRKKVSLAWVVRDAAEKYVADETPLFGKSQ
jgi:metal-responsive CopG/Arc/MetJ family transcriptional regulator